MEDAAQASGASQQEDDNSKGDMDGEETSTVAGGGPFAAQKDQKGDKAKEKLQGKESTGDETNPRVKRIEVHCSLLWVAGNVLALDGEQHAKADQ